MYIYVDSIALRTAIQKKLQCCFCQVFASGLIILSAKVAYKKLSFYLDSFIIIHIIINYIVLVLDEKKVKNFNFFTLISN